MSLDRVTVPSRFDAAAPGVSAPGFPALAITPQDAAAESAIGRLSREFAAWVRPSVVAQTVRACLRELAGSPPPALPELVERLARQRLLQTVPRRHLAAVAGGA